MMLFNCPFCVIWNINFVSRVCIITRKCILCAAVLHQIIYVLWLPSKTTSCHGLAIVLPDSLLSLGLSQTRCCLLTLCPFLSPFLLWGWGWELEAQKKKSLVKIRTMYWKQQRDEKTDSKSNNFNNKRSKTKKKIFTHKVKQCWTILPTMLFPPARNKRESLTPAPGKWPEKVLDNIRVWPCSPPGYGKNLTLSRTVVKSELIRNII